MNTKFSFILLAVIMLSPIILNAQSKTLLYTSDDKKMSILFPSEFTTIVAEDENITTTKTTTFFEDLNFFASSTVHEVEITEQAEMCTYSLESFVETLGGTVTKKSNWENSGNIGLQAMISLADGENMVEYRVIFEGNIQYQLVIAGAAANWKDKLANSFFNSFKIN